MIQTTTPSVDGKRITKYCGIVTGEAILGANVFKDLFAGIRDLVGGRSATYERELQRHHGLSGTADAKFLIAEDGTTRDIVIEGTLPSPTARACIAEEVATWTFPPSGVNTRVNYPLTFRRAGP